MNIKVKYIDTLLDPEADLVGFINADAIYKYWLCLWIRDVVSRRINVHRIIEAIKLSNINDLQKEQYIEYTNKLIIEAVFL